MNRAIGIDIGGTEIKAGLFTAGGAMESRWTRPTLDVPGEDAPRFAKTVREMVAAINLPRAPIGIAAPGLASKDERSIAFMPGKMHGIEGFDWTDCLGRGEKVPVLNDAHAALLGEVWQGAAQGCRDVVLLTLGTGVGGAILSDGRLLRGAIGRAGHLGHVSITESEKCSITGTPGALEIEIGNSTVAQRSGGRFSSTRDLVEAHRAGDAAATRVWKKSVRVLARAIVSFINALDPEIIIIGGGIAAAGDALFDPLEDLLDEFEWRPAGHRVKIAPAKLGEWAGAYGAARNTLTYEHTSN